MSSTERIVIVGGGPAGLGAAQRLDAAQLADWQLYEQQSHVGGLASSYVDEQGFTWDLGGHVVFSHYGYFDRLLDALLKDDWVEHVREAWVWMRDRFIPYPLQNNIRHLPTPELLECLEGLLDVHGSSLGGGDAARYGSVDRASAQEPLDATAPRDEQRHGNPLTGGGERFPVPPPRTFADWIRQSFGAGLARVFLDPYNRKVWATDPAEMSSSWVGERVATVDLKRILRNVIEGRDDLGWGPNATFRFPLHGGTGRIWQAIADRLPPDRLHLNAEVLAIDSQKRLVHLRDGETVGYDWLITTMPLDILLHRVSGWSCDPNPQSAIRNPQSWTGRLRYSSTHVVGVGMAGPVPQRLATKCWMYFPEPERPFYRVTVFSNYSPHNVPRPGQQWSLMAEVSESASRPVEAARVVEQVVEGLRAAKLIEPNAAIESLWHKRVEHGYPTPFLERDVLLDQIEPLLYARNILSRGRFGAWKYEVGNMDHSFMQGVEAVNHILFGEPEVTLRSPATVNARQPPVREDASCG